MNFIEFQVEGINVRVNFDHVRYFAPLSDGRTEIVLPNRCLVVDSSYKEVEKEQLIQEAWSMKLNMNEESK